MGRTLSVAKSFVQVLAKVDGVGMAKSGITMSEQDFNALFEKLDTNKNGQINYTEYMAGAMSVNLLANVKVMEDAFKFFDRDNSGAISKAEVKAALKKGWISDVQMAELFQNADTNKDEKVLSLLSRRSR